MKPTPCPTRLKELIALANLEADSEARKHLKKIADAFRANRQGQKPHSFPVPIEVPITIYANLDGTLTVSQSDLLQTLEEIDKLDSRLDLIRACPICSEVFWAGRADKEACSKHAARWRKSEQRRREKRAKERRVRNRAKRMQHRATKPLELSITTATICDAIFERHRTTETILDYCYTQLSKGSYGKFSGVYRGATVHRGIKVLVDAGYLNSGEEQEGAGNLYYAPTEKLKRLKRELLYPASRHRYFRDTIAESPTL